MFLKTIILFSILLIYTNSVYAKINRFSTVLQWHYANFTWESSHQYESALQNRKYIPGNVAMSGIRFYGNKLYIALPQIRPGTPATLAYIDTTTSNSIDPLLTPFPSWELNIGSDCSTLQSVQTMEIDSRGIMWVIDGVRNNKKTKCPAKLVLLDLKSHGRVVHTYTFPDSVSKSNGGFLNDIVIDEDGENGNFAYITDASESDPGLIVYSYQKNKAWKVFDKHTMNAEKSAANFTIEETVIPNLLPIDGIALSPMVGPNGNRTVFYSALTAFNLYGISTKVLKNEQLCATPDWKQHIELIGKKQSQGDGLIMDNLGNLYMNLLPLYGVAKWNIHKNFKTSEIIDQNREEMVWTDGFAFDNAGYLYLMANKIYRFVIPDYPLGTNEIIFHVMKLYTGTGSYLHQSSSFIT